MDSVPIVNISDPTTASVGALDAACRDHGFFLLEGHGLDALIGETWKQTERFFDADPAIRDALRRSADNPLGFFDRELTKQKRDHKSVFDFVDPHHAKRDLGNRWPDGLPGFRDTLAAFFDEFSTLAARTLHLLHDTLDLSPQARAVAINDRGVSAVRLNHYPVGDPVPEAERDCLVELGETALGYHTDSGVLTLLLQDDTGGLQAESLSDGWIDVEPRPGTIVVNLADTMQVWTNDRYQAAVHRVVPMTTDRRFSIPYFSNPPRDLVVEPLAELCDEPARYRPFAWREFMQARNDDNFADLGAEDTQITRYLVG